jgi:AraC-like DNA-binding protein
LCKRQASIRIGLGGEGIERIEARFFGRAFSPHRHDTYAIGLTLAGVQTFRYRGEQRYCLPGECHILHPDEMHDGASATGEAFHYRIVYLDPRLIQDALGGAPLPFVGTPVVAASRVPAGLPSVAWDIDTEIDDVGRNDLVVTLADLLLAAALETPPRPAALAHSEMTRVRDFIAVKPEHRPSMAALERLSGLDRWTIARQFRLLFGTSPSRFRTLRRLDRVRRLLMGGMPLAEAALEAGFADQSHMSRRFRSAYGLTPAAWLAALSRRRTSTRGAFPCKEGPWPEG